MCGIAGFVSLTGAPLRHPAAVVAAMSAAIAHRGPDGEGRWISTRGNVGLAHRRLAIIDLSAVAAQPMHGPNGAAITYNGEVYNYLELRSELGANWQFQTRSDTECILASYEAYGDSFVERLRGMFAFALWDEKRQRLVCARDRFGIKPFYYAIVDGTLYFASEAKALLPFLPDISTDSDALAEYLTFQYTISDKTLFRHIYQLLPAHLLVVQNGRFEIRRYWDVHYDIDWDHRPEFFERRIRELLSESMALHLRSDVPVGAYVSGGTDSTLVAVLAAKAEQRNRLGFHGRFTDYPGYDESAYAKLAAESSAITLHVRDISAEDFTSRIGEVIRSLDFPVAGPGAFPQYMVSELASKHVKVVLGGQGGDEIFGGYARYLLAYFEQCIKAAIDGTYKNGNYVVTIESIVPNLGLLREYKPMMREFWRSGLFDDLEARYFHLIDRSSDMADEVDWRALDKKRVYEAFREIFNSGENVGHEAYFDKMTHFDFKCLLPALLHVEDRMSMAHGVEARVPLLDHPLVEFAATVPADVKFAGGDTKHLLKRALGSELPAPIVKRRDKMGFPVPLKEWFGNELRAFVQDLFGSRAAQTRPFMNPKAVLANFQHEAKFSRKTWGLISLEIWHQTFHDRAAQIRRTAIDVKPSPQAIGA
ncbi:MAG TPA: asparagine synthase (glutamine-hydrolyzing) [Xanthobacteraceae bacterium]|nr:asparagine synthase (glutamine-hydrolyzing) [Xanthobacteraceae bacterium]